MKNSDLLGIVKNENTANNEFIENVSRPEFSLNEVIDKYVYELGNSILKEVEPSQADKWLAVSSLHKSIRRGDVNLAHRATESLLRLEPDYLFRRLPIITCEDIGIGNIGLCLAVVSLVGKRTRNKYGEKFLAYFLVEQLTRSVKSRVATDIFCLTISDPAAPQYLNSCLSLKPNQLPYIVADTNLSLTHRMTALKLLSGFSDRQSNGLYTTISKPRLDLLEAVCELLNAPSALTSLVIQGNSKTENLNVAMLLAHEMYMSSPTSGVRVNKIQTKHHQGVALSAFDIYCRSGRTIISELLSRSKRLRDHFDVNPNKNPARLIGTMLFVLEGSLLDRELDFEGRSELRNEVELMEIVSAEKGGASTHLMSSHVIGREMELLDHLRYMSLML